MNNDIVLIGAGEHCEGIIDALLENKDYAIRGIIDSNPELKTLWGFPVIGSDACLPSLFKDNCKRAFIAVGSIGYPAARIRLAENADGIGFSFPPIIHPTAHVAKTARLGDGAFVAAGAIINSHAKIGSHAIVNTGAIVEHHCAVEDFAHLAPGAVLCGNVVVGINTHIGANATIIEGRQVGANVLVGAGAVVVTDIPEGWISFGNPSKPRGNHEIR